ncbi:MAG: 2TM domain-containing protein [Ferruginibacter sp.]
MSHNYQPAPEGKDPELWEIAQKRAAFKKHALTYIIVNAFLWGVWYFTGSSNDDELNFANMHWHHYPWPIWTTLGWGIGLAFHFAGAYLFPKANSVEKEYQKLKGRQ